MKSLCSGEEINPCLERMDFVSTSLSLSPEKINVFFLNKVTCVLMLVLCRPSSSHHKGEHSWFERCFSNCNGTTPVDTWVSCNPKTLSPKTLVQKGMETLVAVERTQNPSRETEERMQKEEGFRRKERQTWERREGNRPAACERMEEERRRLCVWRAPKLLFTPISIPRNEDDDDDDKARRDCATTLLCINACDDCCSVEEEALLLLLMSHAASAATVTPLVAVAQGAAPRLSSTTAVAPLDTTATSIATLPRLLVLLLLLQQARNVSPKRPTQATKHYKSLHELEQPRRPIPVVHQETPAGKRSQWARRERNRSISARSQKEMGSKFPRGAATSKLDPSRDKWISRYLS